MRDGYWHIYLVEESSKVTAFATPFGKYFISGNAYPSVSTSPELFQQKIGRDYGSVSTGLLTMCSYGAKEKPSAMHLSAMA